jgi:hypothetical protein
VPVLVTAPGADDQERGDGRPAAVLYRIDGDPGTNEAIRGPGSRRAQRNGSLLARVAKRNGLMIDTLNGGVQQKKREELHEFDRAGTDTGLANPAWRRR